MKKILSLLAVFALLFSCSLLEDDDDEVEKNGPVELMFTENADYPVIGFEEDGTTYVFRNDLQNVFIKTHIGDDWSLNIDASTGRPSNLYMETAKGNYYVLFSNFEGELADIAITKINSVSRKPGGGISNVESETKFALGIEFPGISKTQPINLNKSASEFDATFYRDVFVPTLKRTVSHVTGAAGCALGLASAGVTAFGSGGSLTPFSAVMAAYACGGFASGLAGDIFDVKEFGDLSTGLTVNGMLVDCSKMLATRSHNDMLGCVNGLTSLSTNFVDDGSDIRDIVEKEVKASLTAFAKTGGLIGKWQVDGAPQTTTVNQGGVSQTVTINPMSIEFATTVCNIVYSGKVQSTVAGQNITTDFNYAYKYDYSFTDDVEFDKNEKGYFCHVNFKIKGVTMSGNGTSQYINWAEFKQAYANAGVGLPAGINDMEEFNSYYGMYPETQQLIIDMFNGDDIIFKRK
jgi:hypothetical protein